MIDEAQKPAQKPTRAAQQAANAETPPTAENIRLTRTGTDRGPSITERLADHIDRWSFSSPLHRMRLKGRFPLKLLGVPDDPVPGDTARGQRLKGGRLFRDGYGQAMADARLDAADAPSTWKDWVHGWGWLRDLATVTNLSRAEAGHSETLARQWLTRFHDYDETAWAPHLTGRRILMAISHAPLVMPGHDHIHRSAVLNGIARWARHLDRATPRMTAGFARVEAAAGLMGAALMLPGADDQLDRAERLLDTAIGEILLADGSPLSRSPLELATLADLLAHLKAFHAARGKCVCPVVADTYSRVCAALQLFVTPEYGVGAWHGGQPGRAQVARHLAMSMGSPPPRITGYQRMACGNSVVLVDIGPPPLSRHNTHAHASTLAFTLHDGAQPLVVSCGGELGPEGPRAFPPALVAGLRSTAGHSALVLADTNSSPLIAGGRRGGVEEVVTETRHSITQGHWLEARHDGWRRRFGFEHQRRMWLSPDGTDLRGEDLLLPGRAALPVKREKLPVAIRFHLAPGAEATITQDNKGALIRLPGRHRQPDGAWAFRASFNHAPGLLSIEPSLHVDCEGATHEIQQILLTSLAEPGQPADISWGFRRQNRRS